MAIMLKKNSKIKNASEKYSVDFIKNSFLQDSKHYKISKVQNDSDKKIEKNRYLKW